MDPRLRSLQLVAWHGTVTAAARTLHYTPSAVSAQLKSLSAELGVEVLVRHGRAVRLTPAGELLLRHADELSARWEHIQAELLQVADRWPGSLRLAGFSTAASTLLPRVATAVSNAHPGTSVRIIEADPEECFELLLAGTADLAVVVATTALPQLDDPRFEQRPLLSDPLDLLVPLNHRFAGLDSVPLADTAREPWIMDRPGRPSHQLVLTSCVAAGFTPRQAHEAVEWDTGAALVHAGLGVCLVPRLARLPRGYDIVRVPLQGDPSPSRQIRTGIRVGSGAGPLLSTAQATLTELSLGPSVAISPGT
ncbi:MAG: LysR substrate-binding domain-containing protein [Ornithinimicrobium sp.]